MLMRKLTTLNWFLFVAGAVVFAGCSESSPPPFRLNMTNIVDKQVDPKLQQSVANILGAMFGTPDRPEALPETGLSATKLAMAAGPVWSDKKGAKHGLYRRHCVHCHGISGDGQGPTAAILNPYPRDYRPGVFKFKSTYTANKPTHDDLVRILHDGVPGTAMPSFALLPDDEVEALVEYVKYLAIRGEMETALVAYAADELDADSKFDPASDPEVATIVKGMLTDIVTTWNEAGENVIVPEDGAIPSAERTPEQIAESVKAGRELFYGTRANCIKCHGPTGLGDGQQDDFDNWSKAHNEFIKTTNDMLATIETRTADLATAQGEEADQIRDEINETARQVQQREAQIDVNLPPRNAIPRNLREGIYRGGRRPIDIFWRVSAGIAGTPMPASGPASAGAPGTLTQQEIWQIVEYVHSLPYEPASQPQKMPLNTSAISTGESR
jgi:mono/diheme cytochrome c family protein